MPESSPDAVATEPAPPDTVLPGAALRDAARATPRTVVLTLGSALLAAALLGWGLPRLTGVPWGRILDTAAAAPGWALVALPLLALAALGLGALALGTALEGIGALRAVMLSAVTTAISLAVPGGSMIALGLVHVTARRAGLRLPAIVTGLALVLLPQAAAGALLVPIGVLGYLLGDVHPLSGITTALLVVGALLYIAAAVGVALLLRRGPFARLVGFAVDRLAGDDSDDPEVLDPAQWAPVVLDARDRTAARLRAHAGVLLGAPLLVLALQCGALAVAARAAGLDVPAPMTLAVFALGRVLALVPLTPGGAGLVESGSALALMGFGQPDAGSATAAVLLSITTLLAPLALGLLGGVGLALASRRR